MVNTVVMRVFKLRYRRPPMILLMADPWMAGPSRENCPRNMGGKPQGLAVRDKS